MTNKDKQDVIAVCNILADKMSDGGKVAVQQIIDAVEDMVENEPCEDCISRTEALKVIEEQKKGFYGVERYAIDECHSAVMKLPSVTPQQKWIPCSERLPEEDGLYLVTDVSIYFGAYSTFVLKREKASPSNCVKWATIVAWMPLPEPYKEGEE